MKIQISKKNGSPTSPLTPEGIYDAVVHKVTGKEGDGKDVQPEVVVEFGLKGVTEPLNRAYPAKMQGRSPLLRDSKIILGRGLTREEENEGFDPSILEGCNCQVVVAHRPDSGGKLKAQAKMVLAPVSTAVAALAS